MTGNDEGESEPTKQREGVGRGTEKRVDWRVT